MRWTDLPSVSPVRSLAAWREAQRRAGVDLPLDGDGLVVLMERAARDAAFAHVGARALESGGLLVGVPVAEREGGAPILLVHVTAAVPGDESDATALSLHLHAGVWTRANAIAGEGEVVVGWFHSHPGLGAFFSTTDRRTQAAFFSHAFSLGWVIDPLREEEAWFVGAGSHELAARRVLVTPEQA